MTIHRSALLLVLLAGILLGGLAAPGPGSAHLDLVETTPRDGATLGAPVERVTLSFTVPGEPVGQGIRILDGEGAAVPAAVRESADGTTFVVVPSSPLEAGRFGVAWRVAAPDAHPKTGTFTFRVTPPATRDAGAPGGAPAGAGTGTGGGVEATGADDPLAAALAPPDERGPRALGVAGRALVYGGGLLAIGGLAFLWFAMAGTRREVLRLFAVVRVAGAVVVLGGLIGVVARAWLTEGTGIASAIAPSALRDALGGEAGLSLVLAIAGGAIVALGARAGFRPAPRVALAAWEGDGGSRIVGASPRNAVLAVAGVMAVAVGAALDGHSASEGPRALVWAADLLHTGAAGVWFGGLVLLVAVLVRRRREGRPANAAYAAVRFSTLAGAGLALAGLAGVVLAVIVLPAPSALWTSTWGLLLLAKVVLVGAVALMGAHNHLRLIPRLQADLDAAAATGGSRGLRDDPPLARDAPGGVGTAVRAERAPATHVSRDERVGAALRRNALAETTVLVVVVVLTAVLVAVSAS